MASVYIGLEPYVLTGVTVTDHELGRGSYGTVLELKYQGLKCAGKKIHEALLTGESTYIAEGYQRECALMTDIRHPNIVQFLGVYFQESTPTPILVMEFLPNNLTSYIKEHTFLPLNATNCSILHDIALALCYLHGRTQPIIHRDLSSNNVLLTSNLKAKISDLGMAKIFDLAPIHSMTRTPGTPAYMPPEAMKQSPTYDVSIDIFSYGIILIHMLSGSWPEPKVEPILTEGDLLIPVSEADRRREYLSTIGDDHPLMDLILQCIMNNPQKRPTARKIVELLTEMTRQFTNHVSDS